MNKTKAVDWTGVHAFESRPLRQGTGAIQATVEVLCRASTNAREQKLSRVGFITQLVQIGRVSIHVTV